MKVDAKNESAKAFYLKYGFIPLEKDPLSLFIPFAKRPGGNRLDCQNAGISGKQVYGKMVASDRDREI